MVDVPSAYPVPTRHKQGMTARETGTRSLFHDKTEEVDMASLDGKTIAQAPLVALDEVPRGGFFKRLWDSLLMWWHSL